MAKKTKYADEFNRCLLNGSKRLGNGLYAADHLAYEGHSYYVFSCEEKEDADGKLYPDWQTGKYVSADRFSEINEFKEGLNGEQYAIGRKELSLERYPEPPHLIKEQKTALCVINNKGDEVVKADEAFQEISEFVGGKNGGFFKIIEEYEREDGMTSTRTIFADENGNIYRGKEAEIINNSFFEKGLEVLQAKQELINESQTEAEITHIVATNMLDEALSACKNDLEKYRENQEEKEF